MSRKEYMERLSELLAGISEEERKDALEFYENYFEEAGAGNEADVIAHLGSPEKTAEEIKQGLGSAVYEEGDDRQMPQKREMPVYEDNIRGWWNHLRDWFTSQSGIIKLVVLAAAIFVLLPIAGSVLSFAASVLLGLASVFLGLFCAVFGMMIAGYAAGVSLIVAGIIRMFLMPGVGILMCGVGFLSLAVALLMTILFTWIVKTVIPATIRQIVDVCQKILGKRVQQA